MSFEVWVEDIAATLREVDVVRLPGSPTVTARLLVGGWEGAALLVKSEQDAAPLTEFISLWFGSETQAGILGPVAPAAHVRTG